MRSGIVDVLMGSVVHGCFLVRSPVEKHQHEPGPSPICSCFHTVLDKWFYYRFMLLLWEAEEQEGRLWSSLWTWYHHRLTFGRLQLK